MSAADDSAQASPRPFAWNRLPEELQLEVLSNLDYFELKKARLISREIKDLIETDSSFDLCLFRQKPPMWLEAGTDIEIHPMLHRIGGMVRLPPLIGMVTGPDRYAFDYPAVDEFATAPACTFMFVELLTGDPLYVRDPTGITIRLLATKLADFWTTPPSRPHARAVREYYGYGEDMYITKMHVLGDRNGWAGWRDAKVDESGGVYLAADAYDS